MNPLHPNMLSAAERRIELCRLLASGLLRLRYQQSDDRSRELRESLLPMSPGRSGHATPLSEDTA
jgi:hypothetical protein